MNGLGYARCAIFLMGLLATPVVLPTIDFQSHMSTVQLQPTNAQLKLVNVQQVVGWGDRSIVKTFGHNASSAWPEAYANATVISQSGGTKAPQTELVQANSSAIINLSVSPFLRTMSNAVLYGLRVNSNALLYGDRVTSNSIGSVRTNSNTFALGNRTTSNAVTYSSVPMPIADSIDGTALPRYRTTHHVFHNNGNAWSVRGWVRFNDGFTIMPRASVLMDTLTTVSGSVDLRDTGTLILNNDLYLADNVTLTNGGNIKGEASMTTGGQANTIFMGGDLTLASTTYARTLHITGDWSNSGTSGDLIIDGCGHTLEIGDRAQIFVDTNVTLTLRNMTIKTGQKSLNKPAIQLAAHGSKLALDNVVFDLGADFHFITGQIFIHDEVAMTGTSAFVYQSPVPSYITSGATWSFETGTTFSVAPSTFTDCLFTTNNTYTNNAFILLADASSALNLSGCSMQTTFTGLRLRSGMVLFDNKVAINTVAGQDLVSSTTTPIGYLGGAQTGKNPYSVAWSPDERFLAVANFDNSVDGNSLQIFRFNGNSAPTLLRSIATGVRPSFEAWSPDGRFIALVCYGVDGTGVGGNTLQIYGFNGQSLPRAIGSAAATGMNPYCVAWSPDGRFVAVVNLYNGSGGNSLQVYRFDGVSTPVTVGAAVSAGTSPARVMWSPDGRFIAVAGGGSVRVFRFNGLSAPVLSGATSTGNGSSYVGWSPDGRYISVSNGSSNTLQVFRFTGLGAPVSLGTAITTATLPQSATWSPDARFLGVTAYSGSVQIYKFDGSKQPTALGSAVATGVNPLMMAWSPTGLFLAEVHGNAGALGNNSVQIYRCNYYYTGQPAQSFSNGLVFGDKVKGAGFDANVQVLSGSLVTVNGKVKDDSV